MNPLLVRPEEDVFGGLLAGMTPKEAGNLAKSGVEYAGSLLDNIASSASSIAEKAPGSLGRAWHDSKIRSMAQDALNTASYYAGPHLSDRAAAVPAAANAALENLFGNKDAREASAAFKEGKVGQGAKLLGLGSASALLDVPTLGTGSGMARGLLRGLTKAAHYTPDLSMAAAPIKAFHGSPFDFDRFDLKKMGTGEGGQTYGRGLYFAEKEDVARSYRDSLAPRAAGTGHMYEVGIHADPETLLDWDRPLREQPKVMEALNPILPKTISGLRPGSMVDPVTRGGAVKGEAAWQALAGQKSPEGAAQMLREAGIPGLKYLDAGSRFSAGDKTRNYVAFSDDIVEIMRKYGLAGAGVGLGGAMAMQPGLFPLPQQQ